MDDDMLTALNEDPDTHSFDHPHTIIHIDIDCFYAQVEELRDPTLCARPLGIQQKNIVVTCNYVARSRGVGKLQLLAEAQRICPDLVLVRGEDLTPYRKMSAAIFEVLQRFGGRVEKLGMDENYLDVGELVAERLAAEPSSAAAAAAVEGFVHPPDEPLTAAGCACGCVERLRCASRIAAEIRQCLRSELGITSCAGIAHNKLLAKWVGSRNKPNAQTVFVPWRAAAAMRSLPSLREICGIGERTEVLLRELHITSVAQLQDAAADRLRRQFGADLARKLRDWSHGRDPAAVRASGAPKSIGLEDSCRSISARLDAEQKFRLLLIRLIEQVIEDGRIPIVIKITVRKWDALRRSSHRETKQAACPGPQLFRQLGDGRILLAEGAHEKLLHTVMLLFERAVDLRRPFNITLLGLAFSKFAERAPRAGATRGIASFLIRKADVEVQSITSLSSDAYGMVAGGGDGGAPRYVTASPVHMDFESISDTSHASCSSDVSDTEVEPSPKKSRLGGAAALRMSKRRCLQVGAAVGAVRFDAASPSKLRVGELRLSSRERCETPTTTTATATAADEAASPGAATMALHSLFYPLPLAEGARNAGIASPALESSSMSSPGAAAAAAVAVAPTTIVSVDSRQLLPDGCPPTVDPEVFRALPADVQRELLEQWSNSAAAGSGRKSASTTMQTVLSATATAGPSGSTTTTSGSVSGRSKGNTLRRYFIANNSQ